MKNITVFIMGLLISCKQEVPQKSNYEVQIFLLDSLEYYYNKGEMTEVVNRGLTFTAMYPDNAIGWHLLGGGYLALSEDSLAETYVNQALKLDPSHPAILVNKAVLLDRQVRFEEAREYYEKAIAIDSFFAEAFSNFAANRLYAKDYINAVKLGEIAVELANRTGDKAILCLSYYKAGIKEKSDSLFHELRTMNYPNLDKLRDAIRN